MANVDVKVASVTESDPSLSLYHLLDPEVLANPYPLFRRLRTEDPVHWDPFLHAWVVTRYKDVVTVLHHYSAERTPTPEQLAEMVGNFQHNAERAPRILASVLEMAAYFRSAMREQRLDPRDGLVSSLMNAEIQGDRLSEEEVIANCIVTMVGGQETTTNLIGNGVLALLRNPDQLETLRCNFSLIPSAVEELLRYESPSQYTARLTPEDTILGGRRIRKRQAVIAVMAAGNRDPERFPDPDRLDITRTDNRHLAFGWAAHFCFGAALARIEGQVAFELMLRRLPYLALEPGALVWRNNLGLRGMEALLVTFKNEKPV